MFEAFCQNPQGQGLGASDRFVARCAVGQHPRELRYFRDPAAVGFPLDFDLKDWSQYSSIARQRVTPAEREVGKMQRPRMLELPGG